MLRRWLVTAVLLAGVAMAGAGSFMEARQVDPAQLAFEDARRIEVIDRDVRGAIAKYRDVVTRYASNRAVVANALVRLAACYQQLGRPEATATLQRVVRDFADQPTAVAAARAAMNASRPAVAAQTTAVRRVIYEDHEWNVQAVSPDGRLALGWGGAGNVDLILRTLAANDDRVLFRGSQASRAFSPVFSPNGTMVAFAWLDVGGDVPTGSIAVVGTSANGAPRRITAPVVLPAPAPVAWSTDGTSIIVHQSEVSADRSTTGARLDWVSIDSGSVARSISFPAGAELPAMSPSGDRFAYEKGRAAALPARESRIYTIDSSGGSETEVVRLAGRNRSPVWTPDGSAILFVSNRTGRDGLWAVAMQNGQAAGEPVLIQDSLASGHLSGVAIDGTVYLRQAQPARQHVFVSERVGGSRGQRAFNGEGVSWSPDGTSVAFIKNDGTDLNNALIIRDLASGDERQFDHPSHLGAAQVRWSLDGRSIVVMIRGVGLHVFDVQAGTFSPIANPDGRVRAGVADISPDGKTIYVASRAAGGAAFRGPFTDLAAVDVASGAERKLADLAVLGHMGAGSPAIAVSPDGQFVALQVRLQPAGPVVRARLALIAADGSGSRFLSDAYETVYIPSTITWTPDGQSLLFFTGSQQQGWRLMRASIGGGDPVFDGLESATLRSDPSLPILAPPPPLSLTVSPDGSRIAFGAYAGQSSQLVALDNVPALIARAR